jgi:4-hydroxy-2-oxoheptanedioate aldolase
LTTDNTLARHYLALGATFVAVGLDGNLLVRATNQLAAEFKGSPGKTQCSQPRQHHLLSNIFF